MAGIHENLKKLRASRRLTQEEVAQKIGLTRQAISSYESGRTQPGVELLMRFAEIYEVQLEEILYGHEQAGMKRLKLAAGLLTLFWWLLHLLYGGAMTILHITMFPPVGENLRRYFKWMETAGSAMEVGLLMNLGGCLALMILDLAGRHIVSWKKKAGWFLIYTAGAAAAALLMAALDPVSGVWDFLSAVVSGTFHGLPVLAVDIAVAGLRRKKRGNICGR